MNKYIIYYSFLGIRLLLLCITQVRLQKQNKTDKQIFQREELFMTIFFSIQEFFVEILIYLYIFHYRCHTNLTIEGIVTAAVMKDSMDVGPILSLVLFQ